MEVKFFSDLREFKLNFLKIHAFFSCMLNQTDIKNNANKFYTIQLIESDDKKKYWVWTRWGRVGNDGQKKAIPCSTLQAAQAEFKKKFTDKTSTFWISKSDFLWENEWEDRGEFKAVKGSYTIIDIDYGDEPEEDEDDKKKDVCEFTFYRDFQFFVQFVEFSPVISRTWILYIVLSNFSFANFFQDLLAIPTTLTEPVANLIKLLCDVNTMKKSIISMNIDIKRAPLGTSFKPFFFHSRSWIAVSFLLSSWLYFQEKSQRWPSTVRQKFSRKSKTLFLGEKKPKNQLEIPTMKMKMRKRKRSWLRHKSGKNWWIYPTGFIL